MGDHKLICLVHEREGLYNKLNINFKNKLKKSSLWDEIAKEMGLTRQVCERRWTSLRDRYNKELRKEGEPSEGGATIASNWPHFDSMSFLRGHLLHRNPRSSFNMEVPTVIGFSTDNSKYTEDEFFEETIADDQDTSSSMKTSPASITSQGASLLQKFKTEEADYSMQEATDRYNKELQKENGPFESGATIAANWPHFDSKSNVSGHLLHCKPHSSSTMEVPTHGSTTNNSKYSVDTYFEETMADNPDISSIGPSYSMTTSPAHISSQAASRARKRKNEEADNRMQEVTAAFMSYLKRNSTADPMSTACGTMVTTALAAMGNARKMRKIAVITSLLAEWATEPEDSVS